MSALKRPEPRPGVMAIDAYVPGKSSAPGVDKVFKLSSNETPLGPGRKAIEAYMAEAKRLHEYPDGASTELREAIGRAFGLDPARIVCGAGSDELLNLLAHAFIGPGDEAIHTTHGFLVYHIATLGSGGTPVVAPETNYTADVEAILARVNAKTKNVFPRHPDHPRRPFPALRRGQAPAALAPAADAARSRRGLRRIRPAQRLRVRHRAGRDLRERRDVPHVLEDPWARGAASRLALRAGARGRGAQPHSRTVQREPAGDRGRRGGDRRCPAHRNLARP